MNPTAWRLDWFPTSGLLKKNSFLCCCYSLPVDRSKLEHRTIPKLPEIMAIYNDFTGNWKILRTLVATWLDGTRPRWYREHMAVQRNQRENHDLVVSTPVKNDGVKVSWDDEIPNGKIKAVYGPNHQWFCWTARFWMYLLENAGVFPTWWMLIHAYPKPQWISIVIPSKRL